MIFSDTGARNGRTVNYSHAFCVRGNMIACSRTPRSPRSGGCSRSDSASSIANFTTSNWGYGVDPAKSPTKDDVPDDITLYWLTNSATSRGRL